MNLTKQTTKSKSKPEVFMMRVVKGALAPADNYTSNRLRERSYNIGDLVGCTFKKINNPKFHRLHHHIGQLCVENIEAFSGMDAHSCLKRLQIEGNIACDEFAVSMRIAWDQFSKALLSVPGVIAIEPALRVIGSMLPDSLVMMRVPRSLSFDNIDDGERHEIVIAMCRYISVNYWPSLTPEQIVDMAESWVSE